MAKWGLRTLIFWVIAGGLFLMPVMVHMVSGQAGKSEMVSLNALKKGSVGIDVQVHGAVEYPGIYRLPVGSKLNQLLAHAVVTDGADISALNMVKPLRDGQKITVKAIKKESALVNINLATASELSRVSGIGYKTARKIVLYRDTHGSFESLDGLQSVPGIGEASVNRWRLKLTY
tara:strand:+ start:759 stop:1283 length:525 start_codon:yes stop_codon:yes gene_type:complete